jgi:hypothetical protein
MPDPTCRLITYMNAMQTELSKETPLDTVDSDSESSDSNSEFESYIIKLVSDRSVALSRHSHFLR